jgi:hypothetical protein
MPREFECRREIVVPASPEEVWDAVATTAGNAAWLFPSEVEPGSATAWDPPRRFAVRTEQGDWFNALEFVIEGRDDGTTLMRYMHSGIFVDDWDNQFDAVQRHTDFYLHTLREYLEHFQGRTATYIGDVPQGIAGPPSSAAPDAFERLQQALGLGPQVSEGDSVRLTPRDREPVAGVIYYQRPSFIGVKSTDALYCFFGRNAFGAPVGMSIHAFADDIDAEASKQSWKSWLDAVLG